MFNNRSELTEERKGEADDRSIEMIHSEKQKKERRKRKRACTNLQDATKSINICITGVPKGQEEEKGAKHSKLDEKH